jgi:hypothetical protein
MSIKYYAENTFFVLYYQSNREYNKSTTIDYTIPRSLKKATSSGHARSDFERLQQPDGNKAALLKDIPIDEQETNQDCATQRYPLLCIMRKISAVVNQQKGNHRHGATRVLK